tara:strand:+ start:470 stop:1357 length:888 start_codon:yes stop_codon:yes gene_type:complete
MFSNKSSSFTYDSLKVFLKNILNNEELHNVGKTFFRGMPTINWITFKYSEEIWCRLFPDNIPIEIIWKIISSLNVWELRKLFPKLIMNLQHRLLTEGSMDANYNTGYSCALYNMNIFSMVYCDVNNMIRCAFYETIPSNINKSKYIRKNCDFLEECAEKIERGDCVNYNDNIELENKINEYIGEYMEFKKWMNNPYISSKYNKPYGACGFPWITAYRQDDEYFIKKRVIKEYRLNRCWNIVKFINVNNKYKKKEYLEFCKENRIEYWDKRGNYKGYNYPKSFSLKQYSLWIRKYY